MAVKPIISPEYKILRFVQHQEPQKYQIGRKRSSKDFYPPLMAFIRSRLHVAETKSQRFGHGDIPDTSQVTWKEVHKTHVNRLGKLP
ncbi:hypothetical protein ILYODFUR_038396 [Ilyodon furcidens]|uniref:Uncharacterized protein n=1 Tax=Ilyodon furcidens TaxID=33524 RepID=A0ABV0T5F0_9TELE